jgi:hypothetical protein
MGGAGQIADGPKSHLLRWNVRKNQQAAQTFATHRQLKFKSVAGRKMVPDETHALCDGTSELRVKASIGEQLLGHTVECAGCDNLLHAEHCKASACSLDQCDRPTLETPSELSGDLSRTLRDDSRRGDPRKHKVQPIVRLGLAEIGSDFAKANWHRCVELREEGKQSFGVVNGVIESGQNRHTDEAPMVPFRQPYFCVGRLRGKVGVCDQLKQGVGDNMQWMCNQAICRAWIGGYRNSNAKQDSCGDFVFPRFDRSKQQNPDQATDRVSLG